MATDLVPPSYSSSGLTAEQAACKARNRPVVVHSFAPLEYSRSFLGKGSEYTIGSSEIDQGGRTMTALLDGTCLHWGALATLGTVGIGGVNDRANPLSFIQVASTVQRMLWMSISPTSSRS